MAITKTVIDINGGNTNWTTQHVLDGLEQAFQTLDMNNGTNATGVPVLVQAPSTFESTYTEKPYNPYYFNSQYMQSGGYYQAFKQCGGSSPSNNNVKSRYFKVYDGTNAYRMIEEFRFSASTNVNGSTDTITITRHGLSNGDIIVYAVGQSDDSSKNIGGTGTPLGVNGATDYYVVNATTDTFQISTSSNGTPRDLTNASTSGFYFERKSTAAYDNYTINLKHGDTINFDSSAATGSGTFNLIENSNSYDASKLLTGEVGYQAEPTGQGQNITEWATNGYRQTENEALYPDPSVGEGSGTSLDDYGIVKYMYADSQDINRKGEIVLEPFLTNLGATNIQQYWKYTVAGDGAGVTGGGGAGKDLKLRIYRGTSFGINNNQISAITIHSATDGWSDNAEFTIPGEQIGGVAGVNDLNFGSNLPENGSGAANGRPSLKVSTVGAGANLYQKSNHGAFAIAKVEHDANKNFGTTYYGFGLAPNDSNGNPDARMVVTSGSGWRYINHEGIHSTSTSENTSDFGRYVGKKGLDYQSGMQEVSRDKDETTNRTVLRYGNSNSPSGYPLKIIVYRDNLDTDFAMIQFCQVQNSKLEQYATFSISRGNQHGNGIYDLDYVFQDTILALSSYPSRGIRFYYYNTCYQSRLYGTVEPATQYSVARAASYGYMRQTADGANTSYRMFTDYENNIGTWSTFGASYSIPVVTYYRNSNYDKHDGNSVSSSANYYKPMKGIPVCNNIMPVPYYLPDDFVLLQVTTTPDQVDFKPGDTVIITAGVEEYEIIYASYEIQQTGLDGTASGSTIGMLFMARTT